MDNLSGPSKIQSHGESFRLRSYQAEMVEESMKSNIICVMDTGSGKTHIAIERTRAELESCSPDKLVWFLAPTITLCEQQHELFKSNLPGYGIQLLSGSDNVDRWTKQTDWDAVLLNVRIVLSTHQVLLDALTHAFVKMSKLALLVFDEAHHCTLNHPAHRIMSDFYKSQEANNDLELPKILGLSANPVMRAEATPEALQQIERNLCATARTPKTHRPELMRYVHMPDLIRVDYTVEDSTTSLLASLRHALGSYDLSQDPYVLELLQQRQQGYDISKQMQKVFVSGKTYCSDQLRQLVAKAEATSQELGPSAMEWYLTQCMSHFEVFVHNSGSHSLDVGVHEKKHLLHILRRLLFVENSMIENAPMSLDRISPKMNLLVSLLVAEAKDSPDFKCLVFVEQRIWLACIAEVLALHSDTQCSLRVGTFVGNSQSSKRKSNIATFAEPRNEQTTLDDFRSGTLNVILATSVLEEGIDVSSCHLVICFERPKNLNSFVQRRGRARRQKSKYVIFCPETGAGRPVETWQKLEEEMKAAYLDDLRQTGLTEERKFQDEDGYRYFEVPHTGALLTLQNATSHLHHFCTLLGFGPYIDNRPQFEFTKTNSGVKAQVILPISMDPSIRIANSSRSWATERLAQQDAAFEAYKNLYLAGLVNDNLLPTRQEAAEAAELQIPDRTPALVQVSPILDPWPLNAQALQRNPHAYYRTLLTLRVPKSSKTPTRMILLTPITLPRISDIILYWNQSTLFEVESSWLSGVVLSNDEIATFRFITYRILHSIHQGRMKADRYDFPWLIAPCDTSRQLSNPDYGPCPATELIAQGCDISDWGLVTRTSDGKKFMLTGIQPGCYLEMVQVPKRRDFLHPVANSFGNDAHTRIEVSAASECVVDALPSKYCVFALLFPSILYRFEIGMVAETLRTTILSPLNLEPVHLPLLVRALTSSATGEDNNYQRLELLGDCILKVFATLHLMATHLSWPESYLTEKKGRIVSNGFLARAALAVGLDRFIVTKRFTGAKWSPQYTGNLLAETQPAPKVQKSSKLVADVIESLIGASYATGGLDRAFVCIQTLLPLEPWSTIASANNVMYDAAPAGGGLVTFSILETLLGYTFKKKMLLLEALTHASFRNSQENSSYERLEFLGDAVLDYIVSTRLYAHEPALSHQKMHAIRTATVNASFLAFRMFETTVPEETINKATMQPEVQRRALWQFVRSGSPALNANRDIALRQHEDARDQIITGLSVDSRFPWHLLALNDAPKFLSDIVESVIGATYIDSHGDITACEVVVRRLGILDCLERLLRDSVDCLHPKERLGHLAAERDVQYMRVADEDTTEKRGVNLYRCQVKVGGENVGGVVEGLKRLNAETVAAWIAVGILEGCHDAAMEVSSDEDEFFDANDHGGEMMEVG